MILQRFLIRLLTMIVTLLGVSVVVFVIIRVAPGDPIAMMLPPGATQADIDRLRALYGLDKSLVEQYFIWLSGVLRGDFGTSISLRQDAASDRCEGAVAGTVTERPFGVVGLARSLFRDAAKRIGRASATPTSARATLTVPGRDGSPLPMFAPHLPAAPP